MHANIRAQCERVVRVKHDIFKIDKQGKFSLSGLPGPEANLPQSLAAVFVVFQSRTRLNPFEGEKVKVESLYRII
jgi:hypothetical protein